ncbi:MAG: hypothetical protein DCC65_18500 [Planctomycetota bacterium]|nr:MAG: hypothetical protein DCC65_18500 [Planctomycetota bacterium]
MHIVYVFRHSPHGDEELRLSLRSVRECMPYVERAWILGDRPVWLGEDDSFVRVVGHEEMAWLLGLRTPVTNMFLMYVLAALLPELPPEFVAFSDDFLVLRPFSEEQVRRLRVVEDLAQVRTRGKGLYKDALWRTYDTLRRLGYSGLNFETHTPTWLTKRHVLAAYRDLRDFVSQDRFYGLLAATAIYNHALQREKFDLIPRDAEGLYVDFYDRPFSPKEIAERCAGKTLLNFDDRAFNDALRDHLHERFPAPAPWEAAPPSCWEEALARGA